MFSTGGTGERARMKNSVKNALGLAVALAACYGAAAVGGLFTAAAVRDWYPTLVKPAWNPPAWVFGPVWTVLYGLMATAVWLVWLRRGQRPGATPLVLFAAQLAFHVAWSGLFFGLRRPGLALSGGPRHNAGATPGRAAERPTCVQSRLPWLQRYSS